MWCWSIYSYHPGWRDAAHQYPGYLSAPPVLSGSGGKEIHLLTNETTTNAPKGKVIAQNP